MRKSTSAICQILLQILQAVHCYRTFSHFCGLFGKFARCLLCDICLIGEEKQVLADKGSYWYHM